MSEILLAILKSSLGKIVTDEFSAGSSALARWIVKRSARALFDDRERYEEQWLADLEDRKTPLQKLSFAVGILWAARGLKGAFSGEPPVVQTPVTEVSERSRLFSEEAAYWYFMCIDAPSMLPSDRREFIAWIRRTPENVVQLVMVAQLDGQQRRLTLPLKRQCRRFKPLKRFRASLRRHWISA